MTKTFQCSDPKEANYRETWHRAKAKYEENPTPATLGWFKAADRTLSDYIWNRTLREIEEDRRKHPKAKRNQPAVNNPDKQRHLP